MPIERVPYEACPICEEKKHEVLHEDVVLHLHGMPEMGLPKKVTWLECTGCGHAFTKDYWDEETTRKIWEKRPEPGEIDTHQEREQWARIVGKCIAAHESLDVDERYHKGKSRSLDVGYGDGVGLTVFEEYGFEAMGIDVRDATGGELKRLGYNVIEADFAECNAAWIDSEKAMGFDVIVMAEFLEHQPFPVETLKRAKSLLRPGGVIYASVPSRDCLVWKLKLGRRDWATWGQVEHLHAFGRKQLELAFRKAELEPVAFHVGERYYETMEVIGR